MEITSITLSILLSILGGALIRVNKHIGIFFSIFFAFKFSLTIINFINSGTIIYDNWKWGIVGENILSLKIDEISLQFLTLIAIFWPIALIYSIWYFYEQNKNKISLVIASIGLTILFASLTAISSNLIGMFIFYELLTFSTLPLLFISKSPNTVSSIKYYFLSLVGISSCLFLPAIILTQKYFGSIEFITKDFVTPSCHLIGLTIFLLYFFGINKTSIFPLHSWLNKAMIADYPISAMLHSVTIVKIGIFCLIRVMYYIFGTEYLNILVQKYTWIICFPIFGIVWSSFQAIRQENIKNILAFSTISQLNFMVMILLSAKNITQYCLILNMFAHSFAKIFLFFLMGYIYKSYQYTRVEQLSGLIKKEKLISILIILSILSLIGFIPLFPMFYVKLLFKYILDDKITLFILSLTSFLTTCYTANIIFQIYRDIPEMQSQELHNKISLKNKIFITTSFLYSLLMMYYLISNLLLEFDIKTLVQTYLFDNMSFDFVIDAIILQVIPIIIGIWFFWILNVLYIKKLETNYILLLRNNKIFIDIQNIHKNVIYKLQFILKRSIEYLSLQIERIHIINITTAISSSIIFICLILIYFMSA